MLNQKPKMNKLLSKALSKKNNDPEKYCTSGTHAKNNKGKLMIGSFILSFKYNAAKAKSDKKANNSPV